MALLRGNTATTFSSSVYSIPVIITQYFFTNMTGSAITVTLAIEDGTPTTFTVVQDSVPANSTYQYDIPIQMKIGDKIKITVTASCDYYLNIE